MCALHRLSKVCRAPFALGACLLASALLAGGAAAATTPAPPPPGPPAAVSLDGSWQSLSDPHLIGAVRGWQRGGGRGWQATTVPGVFDARPLARLFKGRVAWYRLTFTGPATAPGFGWALRFEQVRRTARVWLNGREIGAHADPYTAFMLPAVGLRPGAPNSLVVRVDNRKGAEPREGWWNWGGITRAVTLVPQGPVTMRDAGLLPRLRCSAPGQCTAAVTFDGWVTNATGTGQTPSITIMLTPPNGGPVTRRGLDLPTLAPGQTVEVRDTFPVAGTPQLWEPDHPFLYAARLQTYDGSALSQQDDLDIGLRSVSVRDGDLYLNGRPVQLSGASIAEDVPGHGPALTDADMDQMVSELQAVHANVTRAQYPLNPSLLDRLDRAGILVWSQAPIYHRDEQLVSATQRRAALATLRGTVLADRDHPSVITYSVANELSPTPDAVPGTRAYLDAAASLTHALDPTLPVALDLLSYPGYPAQRTYRRFQLLGINNYFGWYPGRAPHATANAAGLAPYLREMHRRYPQQAMVMTEFGAEATIHGPATRKQTFEFQSAYLRHTLDVVHALPFMNGAIYWTLREFAVKPHWIGGAPAGTPGVLRDSIHHKGLLTYAGVPKPAWVVARDIFAATPLFRATTGVVRIAGPSTRGTAWSSLLILVAALLALLGLVLVDIRLFLRLRVRAGEPDWAAPVVALRREDREARRTYA